MVAFLVVIGIFVFIGSIGNASEPKCIKAGCDNNQASGSSYCYLHKPSSSKYSSYSSSSYGNKASVGSSSSTGSSTNSYSGSSKSSATSNSSYSNTNKRKNTYDSYDDGYDDIYMDGDYDYDRYDRDSDYADGVDDAMDEFEEDW